MLELAQDSLTACLFLSCISMIIQSIELLRLRAHFGTEGIWRWQTLQADFQALPGPMRAALAPLLSSSGFNILQAARLCAAAALAALCFTGRTEWPAHSASLAALLFLASVATNLRFRGTFNGGSDFMSLIVLTGLVAALMTHASSGTAQLTPLAAALGYIAFHVCASYFVAGWIKLKRANWRSGRALQGFLTTSIYEDTPLIARFRGNRRLCQLASWGVILWELSFPLSILHPASCAAYLCVGAIFHLTNAYLFGLNRFFWAWVSAYPALWFVARALIFHSR